MILTLYCLYRDGILLKAFDTGSLDFSDFRMMLKRLLLLDFTDNEWIVVCGLFDEDGSGDIDGSEFLVVFSLLKTIAKQEKQENDSRAKQEREDKQRQMKIEKEAAIQSGHEDLVDYDFTEADKISAYEKV